MLNPIDDVGYVLISSELTTLVITMCSVFVVTTGKAPVGKTSFRRSRLILESCFAM